MWNKLIAGLCLALLVVTGVPALLATPGTAQNTIPALGPLPTPVPPDITQGPLPSPAASTVAWSPDGSTIALGGPFGLILYAADITAATVLTQDATIITDLAWSPDSSRIAAATAAQGVIVWDRTTREQLATLNGTTVALTSVAWSPDGATLASSSVDGTVLLWDTSTYTQQATLPYTGTSTITTLAWNPTSTQLAGGDIATLYVWDVATQTVVSTFFLLQSAEQSLEWSPDGQQLITAGPQVLNATTGDPIGPYETCSDGTDTVAQPRPDGTALASAGVSRSGVSVCIVPLTADPPRLLAYPATGEALIRLTWNPNGSEVAGVTGSGWLHLWDAASGEKRATLPRPGVTLAELERQIIACTASDGLEVALSRDLQAADYSGFIDRVAAQPADLLQPDCNTQLIGIAHYLTNNPLSATQLFLPIVQR